ncbi:excinuclease ABC subunit A, partial [Piscirickettsia salmonis]
ATYVGFWDDVRKQFADTREARMRGWTAARFSFNTGDGRCPICEGQGMRTIEMNFLPDVKVPCDACNGARFNSDTLSVQMRGKNAGELLSMEVDDAIEYFAAHPKIHRPLQLMQDVGLGYLTLGQPSPTLSGGEAQRINLTTALGTSLVNTLFVLDEPSIGLHPRDMHRVVEVMHRLRNAGNTLVVVEHDPQVMVAADRIIDIGPGPGERGGQIVF